MRDHGKNLGAYLDIVKDASDMGEVEVFKKYLIDQGYEAGLAEGKALGFIEGHSKAIEELLKYATRAGTVFVIVGLSIAAAVYAYRKIKAHSAAKKLGITVKQYKEMASMQNRGGWRVSNVTLVA